MTYILYIIFFDIPSVDLQKIASVRTLFEISVFDQT